MSTHKTILSLNRVRLASTRGHIIIVEPRVPTRIPEALFIEAAKNSCVDYNPEMIEAFSAAMDRAGSLSDEDGTNEEVVDVDRLMLDSVRQVLLAADDNPDLLTGQGVPRTAAVRAAFEQQLAIEQLTSEVRVTRELVEDYYIRVRDTVVKSEPTPAPDADRYPGGVPGADLEGEEVGGDVEDMLERVADAEE